MRSKSKQDRLNCSLELFWMSSHNSAQERPRGAQDRAGLFFSAPRRSKSVSRGSQEAFSRHLALKMRFEAILHQISPLTRGLGTAQIKEFCKTSSKFCDFALFSSSRLRESIWDPPGFPFGTLLAETSLGIPLGAAQSR